MANAPILTVQFREYRGCRSIYLQIAAIFLALLYKSINQICSLLRQHNLIHREFNIKTSCFGSRIVLGKVILRFSASNTMQIDNIHKSDWLRPLVVSLDYFFNLDSGLFRSHYAPRH